MKEKVACKGEQEKNEYGENTALQFSRGKHKQASEEDRSCDEDMGMTAPDEEKPCNKDDIEEDIQPGQQINLPPCRNVLRNS